MKLLILFILLLPIQSFSSIVAVNGEIQPFKNSKYYIKDLIKDYAELVNVHVLYEAEAANENDFVHLELNTKTSLAEFKKIFYGLLANASFTPVEEGSVLWINTSREIRYTPTKVFKDESFPKDASYNTVIYKLKYPLSSVVARNMRPFMSRYGRIIDLSDARTLIINDRGDNTTRLIETIKKLDTESAFQDLVKFQPKAEEDEENPLNEKILDLELEKKLLEKKYLDLKGEKS